MKNQGEKAVEGNKLPNPNQEIEISVVIPCYNEQANLESGVLNQVATHLESKDFSWEVIIVDDESTDESLKLCTQFSEQHANFHVIQVPHGGKPHAIYYGLLETKGRLVLFIDMDQSTPISELDKLVGWFDEGYDVVIGSRGIQRYGFSLIRRIASWGFRTLRRLILLPEIVDTQCGFKILNAEVAKRIFPKLSFLKKDEGKTGWVVTAYDVELLFLAKYYGYKIREVEVEWFHSDKSVTKGNNQKRYLRESLEMGKQILSIVGNRLAGRY